MTSLAQGQEGAVESVLAECVVGVGTGPVPPAAQLAFRKALTDYLTCALLGARQPANDALVQALSATEPGGDCTVYGRTERFSAGMAALANGANAHALDFDDGYTRGSTHPGGVVFSAALAVAERENALPETLMRAVVAGYEVMLRISAAIHPGSARRGWHNTAVAGVFGATAAAALIQNLGREALLNAFGMAASFAGGLRAFLSNGADVKRLHPGKAARDGIFCADLARHGLTGPEGALSGPLGFFGAFVNHEEDTTCLAGAADGHFLIEDIYFKPYPCCRHFHAALDAVLWLRRDLAVDPAAVTGMTIGLYRSGAHGHDHKHAVSLLDAQMSAPVTVALALATGALTLGSYAAQTLARPEIRRLVEIAETVVDPECDGLYPGRRSGRVTLTLADGRSADRLVLDPRGEGGNPLSADEIDAKLLTNIGADRSAEYAERLLGLVQGLGAQPSLSPLFSMLRSH